MRQLYCRCGQLVFCDNTRCQNCGRTLGFDPFTNTMYSLDESGSGELTDAQGQQFKLCDNRVRHEVCNGLVQPGQEGPRCPSCTLNRTIPSLRRKRNILLWSRLERAKRRLVSGLTALGLHLFAPTSRGREQVRFDFMEDKRSHPDVLESFVSTGHKDGVITINLLEADDVQRVKQRQVMGERYRTLLGHFRHEAGHFYYSRLVKDDAEFARLFGDPMQDYDEALSAYYAEGPPDNWAARFISAYASSHPSEDWAECFAHYLHMCDALETAAECGRAEDVRNRDFETRLAEWNRFTLDMNEISRSLGVRDPYPFVITSQVAEKLAFVDRCIERDLES